MTVVAQTKPIGGVGLRSNSKRPAAEPRSRRWVLRGRTVTGASCLHSYQFPWLMNISSQQTHLELSNFFLCFNTAMLLRETSAQWAPTYPSAVGWVLCVRADMRQRMCSVSEQIQLPCLPQRVQLGLSPNLLVASCSVAVKDVMEGLSLLTTSNGFHSIMQELHCASENEIHSLCMAYGTEGVCVVMCVWERGGEVRTLEYEIHVMETWQVYNRTRNRMTGWQDDRMTWWRDDRITKLHSNQLEELTDYYQTLTFSLGTSDWMGNRNSADQQTRMHTKIIAHWLLADVGHCTSMVGWLVSLFNQGKPLASGYYSRHPETKQYNKRIRQR